MSEKCAHCGSTNLESRDHDLWHYMRNCRNCGSRTRYNSKGAVVSVVEGKDRGFKQTSQKNYNHPQSDYIYRTKSEIDFAIEQGKVACKNADYFHNHPTYDFNKK